MNNDREDILKIPELAEAQKAYKNDGLTEEDVVLCQFYKLLIKDYFDGLGIFEETEKYMASQDIEPVPEGRRDFFQKTDLWGYKYFYLSSIMHPDKLQPDVRKELLNAAENFEDKRLFERAQLLAVSVLADMLMLDKDRHNYSYSLTDSDRGDMFVGADEIVIGFGSYASFDENGAFVSKTNEDNRVKYMVSRPAVLEEEFLRKTGYKLKIIVKL